MTKNSQEKKANPIIVAIFAAATVIVIIIGYVAIGRIEDNIRIKNRRNRAKVETVFDLDLGLNKCEIGELYIVGGRNNIWLSGIDDYEKFVSNAVNGEYVIENSNFRDKKCYSVSYDDDKPTLEASIRHCEAKYIVKSEKSLCGQYELYFYEDGDNSFSARLYGIQKDEQNKK